VDCGNATILGGSSMECENKQVVLLYGDYTEDFNCLCGSPIDVIINWNNGDETPRCRNRCNKFSIQWYCDTANARNNKSE